MDVTSKTPPVKSQFVSSHKNEAMEMASRKYSLSPKALFVPLQNFEISDRMGENVTLWWDINGMN
jgi:hypothetical protein